MVKSGPQSYGITCHESVQIAATIILMCKTYDPQHQAEAAMKRAAAAEGADRQRLIQLALAWQQLARDRRNQQTD